MRSAFLRPVGETGFQDLVGDVIANVAIGWGRIVRYGPLECVEHGPTAGIAAQDGAHGVGTASFQDCGVEFGRGWGWFATETDAEE